MYISEAVTNATIIHVEDVQWAEVTIIDLVVVVGMSRAVTSQSTIHVRKKKRTSRVISDL